jgi:transcriptional regulator with XRE-family HTH domain
MARRSVGQRVRALREAKGLTQDELATRAGLHRVHVTQIEGGRYESPRLDTLRRLAKALGVSLAELLE